MKALPALFILLLAGACQLVDRAAPATEAPATAPAAARLSRSNADELVAYLVRLRGMNEGGLAAESIRQKQLAARATDDMARLKAALALALAPQSDENEILAFVDPLVRKESAPADVRAMASFLQVWAQDRRRLKMQKQRADVLQERAAQLQQKLDALTELEKSLSDRPPPSR
jgi:hypothetical protein